MVIVSHFCVTEILFHARLCTRRFCVRTTYATGSLLALRPNFVRTPGAGIVTGGGVGQTSIWLAK
jgi:hypothetical protein